MTCLTGTKEREWRVQSGAECKAADISRTQYEVYSISTKNNLSEAAVDELLEMLSNVCASFLVDPISSAPGYTII